MLWHPSLPTSTASESLPGNPGGGGSPSGPTRLLSCPLMDNISAAAVSSDRTVESATPSLEASTAASPLQDASAMPRLPPNHRGGLKWRRSCWRGSAGGRRRRVAGQQRRPWVSGRGRAPMPAEPWTSGKRGALGRRAAAAEEPRFRGDMASTEEFQLELISNDQEETANVMEITREDEEETGGSEKLESEAEITLRKEEESVDEEEEEGGSGGGHTKRESRGESGLIGARKRKSNKVMKRELEPRVDSVDEAVREIITESTEEEGGVEEEDGEDGEAAGEGRGDDEAAVQRTGEEDVRYVCPICEDVLSSQHLFTVHIRSHNAASSEASAANAAGATASGGALKAFSCRICGKALSSSSSLDRHMLVHSGERPFKCRLCGVAFTTNGNMHRHMRTHAANSSAGKDPEEVSDCGSSDSGGSKKGKATPKKNRAPTPATTPSPGGGRKRQANGGSAEQVKPQGVRGERRRAGTKEAASELGWRCLACDISFRNQRALRLHAYMTHRELEPEEEEDEDLEEEDYEEEEGESRGSKRSKREGGGRSGKTPTLGFQDLTFVDFSTQKFPLIARAVCEKAVHRASSEFHRFHCGRCDRAFPCGSALHIHADSQHRATSTSPADAAPPSADDPKEDFFAVLNLQNKTRCCTSSPSSQGSLPPPHFRLFPHSNSTSLSHLPYAEKKRREEEFDNAFYFNSPAMKPKDLHASAKKGSSEDEDGREASEAPKDLADINSIISAVASNASGLMRSVEEEEEEEGGGYEEEEEEEDATFAAELREMKARGEFPCKLCPSLFPNLRALKGHSRCHVSEIVDGPPGEDDDVHRYPCCLCGRRVASDKHGLARHLRSHNGERPFRCALCRYAFTTKANCERHLRNRHSKASREEIRRSVIYSPVADESSAVHPNAESEERGRPEVVFASSLNQCHTPSTSPIPNKLSALLTAISDAKSNLASSDSFGREMDRADNKSKFSDNDGDLRMVGRESGQMDDLSSVEALVNFAKSPSLTAPLSIMSGQIPLPMQQHLLRPIAVKQERGKESDALGAEAPLDLSMDALDLSSKKTQDEPEDLSRPTAGKPRPSIPVNAAPIGVGFNGGLLMPVRLPTASSARPMVRPTSSENPQINQVPKMDSSPGSLSNGTSRAEVTSQPSASSFYPSPLHMYLNPQFPTAGATSARPPIGNFPYLLPLPFPSSSAPLIPHMQSTQPQSPSLLPILSPPTTQALPSHKATSSYPGVPISTAPPSMERLEKEILRNLQLSSGGSLVLDPASVADRIQAIAMAAAAAAAGFSPAATTSEHVSKPTVSQTKDSKPNDPASIAPMREATPSKEDPRMQPGVKMVIKNGVLMPKQKQRRYRTERPFACCHCSARFTLRSNMERHIKQQHPEFWSQRPRGGRRGGLSGSAPSRTDASPSAADARLSNSPDGPLPPTASLPAESAGKPCSEDGCSDYRDDDANVEDGEKNNVHPLPADRICISESSTNLDDSNDKAKDSNKTVISEEVKNAIAQQLKSKLIADCRPIVDSSFGGEEAKKMDAKDEAKKHVKDSKDEGNADDEEDSGELVIDEEKMDAENECSVEKGRNSGCSITKEDESSGVDLASVSKLLDNASTQTFQQYFKSEEDEEMEERRGGGDRRGGDEGYDGGADGEDEDEEEGWKSGDEETAGSKSASSGEEERLGRDRDDSLERKLASVTVEAATAADTEDKGKRRSAYSSAPNRVSCPYCMRKFPWRSSLRRHILTHTGQKPYKCAHCPLLFTTKSNCDRHLLRKHGRGGGGSSSGAEDAASVVSSSGGGALSPGGAYAMRNVPERPYKCSVCPSSTFSTQNNLKKHLATKHQHLQPPHQSNSGRCSASPRGGSEKGGSISSASSPRCATEERDVDDEEDEEGLVGAEDEDGEEEEEEEGGGEEEGMLEEELAEGSGGEAACNGEVNGPRGGPRKRAQKSAEKSLEESGQTQTDRRREENGAACDGGKASEKEGATPPAHHDQQNNQVHRQAAHHQILHQHHHHHHHHPGSDLPFKCHLCERSYAERNDALNHIRDCHASEYELLVAKGALDSATAISSEDSHNNNSHGGANHNNNNIAGLEQAGGEENLEQLRGKFPDYANRKVVCAFCMRRFWSAEDLRRHMRTHTGERPFSCDICARRFTLKHSMLRHRKKHSAAERASGVGGNPLAAATSEASGDEEAITTRHRSAIEDAMSANWERSLQPGKDEEEKEGKRRKLSPQEIGLTAAARAAIGGAAGAGDLIGNLLGIQDGSIIDKMLLSKSANDAAKLLGVEGHD